LSVGLVELLRDQLVGRIGFDTVRASVQASAVRARRRANAGAARSHTDTDSCACASSKFFSEDSSLSLQKGVDVVVVPTANTSPLQNLVTVPSRALENLCFVVYCNRVGLEHCADLGVCGEREREKREKREKERESFACLIFVLSFFFFFQHCIAKQKQKPLFFLQASP